MNTHSGHRQRMKQRFLKEGLDNFDAVNVLELLLFYALPRRDTNLIAHDLLRRFGSLAGVLEAPVEQLQLVPGLGEHAALLISLGTEILLVSERLGHENVETTLNVYGHLYPSRREKTVQKLDELAKVVPK